MWEEHDELFRAWRAFASVANASQVTFFSKTYFLGGINLCLFRPDVRHPDPVAVCGSLPGSAADWLEQAGLEKRPAPIFTVKQCRALTRAHICPSDSRDLVSRTKNLNLITGCNSATLPIELRWVPVRIAGESRLTHERNSPAADILRKTDCNPMAQSRCRSSTRLRGAGHSHVTFRD